MFYLFTLNIKYVHVFLLAFFRLQQSAEPSSEYGYLQEGYVPYAQVSKSPCLLLSNVTVFKNILFYIIFSPTLLQYQAQYQQTIGNDPSQANGILGGNILKLN